MYREGLALGLGDAREHAHLNDDDVGPQRRAAVERAAAGGAEGADDGLARAGGVVLVLLDGAVAVLDDDLVRRHHHVGAEHRPLRLGESTQSFVPVTVAEHHPPYDSLHSGKEYRAGL